MEAISEEREKLEFATQDLEIEQRKQQLKRRRMDARFSKWERQVNLDNMKEVAEVKMGRKELELDKKRLLLAKWKSEFVVSR